MNWFPDMFCQFYAHKGPKKVSTETCGHFQYVFVPWTCEFVPQKKFSNQHLSGKMFSASLIAFQTCFVSLIPTKVLKRSQQTLVGTSNVLLCLGHVNLSHRKKSPTNIGQKKFLCLMFSSTKMFCKFHAHKSPQEVSKQTCGHFQGVSVPWTCEFDPQKKFSNQS